jgi:hypothetical protein
MQRDRLQLAGDTAVLWLFGLLYAGALLMLRFRRAR